jgi:hypothetical protein
MLPLGYNHQWKREKWRTLFLFMPKINSDFGSSASERIQFGGVVLVKYQKSKKLNYHLGLYYNRELFGNYFVPLFGIEWKASDKINIFGDIPNNMTVEYKAGKSLYGGITYSSFVSSYQTNDSKNMLYAREGDKRFGHNQLKSFVNYYVQKRIVIYVEAGRTLYRYFTLYDYSDVAINDPASVLRKVDDGFFIGAGIAYRVRLY